MYAVHTVCTVYSINVLIFHTSLNVNVCLLLVNQSEPYDDESTYRGDIIVGLKFVPPDAKSSHFSRSSIGSGLRKFGSIKSSPGSRNTSTKGSLHVLVKEAKNLSPVKASGTCDAFCKR